MDKINTKVGDVSIQADFSGPIDRISAAQKALNLQIVADSTPYIPFQQGALRSAVSYPDGVDGGEIQWGGGAVGVPYAHYQYMGTVYGPNYPQKDAAGNIIGWASPPKKYPTQRNLQYHTPGTTAQWVEAAKAKHLPDWEKIVKDKLTGD